jgi:hypothetical protein
VTDAGRLVIVEDVKVTSAAVLAALVEQAESDEEAVRAYSAHIRCVESHLESVRELRDDAAARLRTAGMPMVRLAALAGVSDSHLTRRILANGGKRRVDRKYGSRRG